MAGEVQHGEHGCCINCALARVREFYFNEKLDLSNEVEAARSGLRHQATLAVQAVVQSSRMSMTVSMVPMTRPSATQTLGMVMTRGAHAEADVRPPALSAVAPGRDPTRVCAAWHRAMRMVGAPAGWPRPATWYKASHPHGHW